MKSKKRKSHKGGGNATFWLFVGISLSAAMILDKRGQAPRWDAAIVWTAIAFGPAVSICRNNWSSSRFWIGWSALLGTHIGMMWFIFSYLLPHVFVGMLYVMPLGFIEMYLVLMCVSPRWRIHFRRDRQDRLSPRD